MSELIGLLPEVILVFAAASIVLWVSMAKENDKPQRIDLYFSFSLICILFSGLSAVMVPLLISHGVVTQVFSNAFKLDPLTQVFRVLSAMLGFLAVYSVKAGGIYIEEDRKRESYALIFGSMICLNFLGGGEDLLLVFVSLEILGLLSLFLSGFDRKNHRSSEAGMKYLLMLVFSSALFILGLVILFQQTQSFNVSAIHQALLSGELTHLSALIAFSFLFFSICFFLGAFPMNLWVPDVVQGSPTALSAYVFQVARAAGVAMFLRVIVGIFSNENSSLFDWTPWVSLAAGVSLVFGPLHALRQTDTKRALASLGVASVGTLLMAFLAMDQAAHGALIFNLIFEAIAYLGAFFMIAKLDELGDRYSCLTLEKVLLVLFVFGIAALPPLPSFIGRFALVQAAIRHGYWLLAFVSMFSWMLSTIAACKISFKLFLKYGSFEPRGPVLQLSSVALLVCVLLPSLFCMVMTNSIMTWAGRTFQYIFW